MNNLRDVMRGLKLLKEKEKKKLNRDKVTARPYALSGRMFVRADPLDIAVREQRLIFNRDAHIAGMKKFRCNLT